MDAQVGLVVEEASTGEGHADAAPTYLDGIAVTEEGVGVAGDFSDTAVGGRGGVIEDGGSVEVEDEIVDVGDVDGVVPKVRKVRGSTSAMTSRAAEA